MKIYDRFYTRYLTAQLKVLNKRQQAIIKLNIKTNVIEKTQSIDKTKCWFFEKFNKDEKFLPKLTKNRRKDI